jgi:hypothetical protein
MNTPAELRMSQKVLQQLGEDSRSVSSSNLSVEVYLR